MLVTEAIINYIIAMFIVGSIPFFLTGTNKDFNKKSIYSKSKTQLIKIGIIGLLGFISLLLGGLLTFFSTAVNNLVDLYDSQYKLPFVGGIGSLILFLIFAFIFNAIITSSSKGKN